MARTHAVAARYLSQSGATTTNLVGQPFSAETMGSVADNSLLAASRAWFDAPLDEFLTADVETVYGKLARNSEFSVELDQRDAWQTQIEILQKSLVELQGHIYLEFNIPRMGKRIDAVVLAGPLIFVVEFKVGARKFDRASIDQAWDYALDLKNFHEASNNLVIVPILVATKASNGDNAHHVLDNENVYEPISVAPKDLRPTMDETLRRHGGPSITSTHWHSAPYRPTPTIIEAARSLYAQHGVEAIRSFDAGQKNLASTSARVEQIVRDAQTNARKSICFVTGVPGAGKTLVGLNLATQHRAERVDDPAVFLSGNGPLVAVLREALIRDEHQRRKEAGEKVRKSQIGHGVKQFIQNVHHFRDDNLQHPGAPAEHIAIFDEAQRAWNLRQTANFMQRRKKVANFAQSEPEFLISCMDRHKDWSVVVCLVGGGQEINTGEAGIEAWLDAADSRFGHWNLHISSMLHDSEYAAGRAIERLANRANVHWDDDLHLGVSMRSFRAERVSSFVKALLDRDADAAKREFAQFQDRYPICVTREMIKAKDWLRTNARGTQRFGLVCSSKAMRLKPHAIDVRHNVNPVHWFLNGADDTRSSQYLEDAATEFQVQGLEVDWACVNWDADLRSTDEGWSHHDFRGSRWINIHNEANRQYLVNAYRVLLTRARRGMVIFVPPGDSRDPTRIPEWYDETFEYLKAAGIPEL